MLSSIAFDPGLAYQAYQAQEETIRKDFLSIEGYNAQTLPSEEIDATHVLRVSALFLEMVLVVACGMEFLEDQGSQDSGETLAARIKTQCDLDLSQVFQEALSEFPLTGELPAGAPLPPMHTFIRSVKSIVAACPIEALEELGELQGLPTFGFRCRKAFEALNSFMFRQDPQIQKRAKLVGQIYAKGEISLEDVSLLIDLHAVDAIWWLEQSGYSRSIQAIQLSESEREQRFLQMDQDRLKRQGEPEFSEDSLLRDVISSERIEGIDARPWFR